MLIGQIIDNRYEVIEKIGSGSFGETGIAIDTKFPGLPLRAVKQLCPKNDDPEALIIAERLFQTEAECLAKLGEHDRIPRLFSYFEEKEDFFLVQELIEGQNLTDEFQYGKRWSEEGTVKFLQELLSILSVVHQQNVIHRDIKPANIMRRNKDAKLVLIDFGAVKEILTVDEDGQTHISSSTIGIGTPIYMPHEQAGGKPGKYSDIYAVGILGVQAISGFKLDYLQRNPPARFKEILNEQQIKISPSLKSFVCKAIAFEPQDRFVDAVEALEALISNETETIPTLSTAANTVRIEADPTVGIKSFPKKLILGIISAFVLVSGAGIYTQTFNQPDYTQLETYLENQQWEQADAETNKIILQVAGEKSALDVDSTSNFDCNSLQKLDYLWTTNSNGKFGFTPQKEIYLATGNEFNNYAEGTYDKFGDRIGWRTKMFSNGDNFWNLYGNLKFKDNDLVPKGHLPSPGIARDGENIRHNERGELLSRFDECGL